MELPWLAALVMQLILEGILLAKRTWRRFPLFFLYASSSFIFGINAFVVHNFGSPLSYFIAYWINEGLGLLLGLAVIYEIFNCLIAPYPGLRKLGTAIFQLTIAFLVLFGCVVVFLQPRNEHSSIVAAFYIIEEATRILEVGLFGFLFLFATAFGLHWRQYVFGIALGLGVFTAVKLVAVMMRVQLGVVASPAFNLVQMISFHASMVLWIAYLLAPDLVADPAAAPKRAQLEQWNRAIMELIYQ
jgi:hypothetical protein